MVNSGYPTKGVYGYKSLHWAVNDFIQTNHEFESLPISSEMTIDKYVELVDSALYLCGLVEDILAYHAK